MCACLWAPLLDMINHVELCPPPRSVHPAGVSFATRQSHAHAHTYTMVFTVSVLNVMQCSAM